MKQKQIPQRNRKYSLAAKGIQQQERKNSQNYIVVKNHVPLHRTFTLRSVSLKRLIFQMHLIIGVRN